MSTTIDESYVPDFDFDDDYGEGGNRRLIFLILVAVLVLAIGALAYWRLAIYKPGKQTLAQVENTTNTYSLGQQTMNLSDGSLVQVTVVMHLTTVADVHEIAQHSNQLSNAEIFVFGSMSAPQLLTDAGKLQAQHALLTRFNHILGKRNGWWQVQGILFHDFVLSTSGAPVGSGGG